jgi:predicted nucleic acid-binding protein
VELFDTSVWAWRGNSRVAAWFDAALLTGELAVCEMVLLEILSGAPNRRWYEQMRELFSGVTWVRMGSDEWARALEVHALLETRLGTNARRGVKHADMLIAAAAEMHGLTLVHYDQDFEVIQQVSNQSMRWVEPRGTL